jgi:ATP phosphoribosyltransferase regulatory subunit
MLLDLRGRPADVLERVSRIDLDPTQRQMVSEIKSLVELINETLVGSKNEIDSPITLDLSLIQSFDYYTGLVFEVVNVGAAGQHVLGQGGRYDQLLGLYHPHGKTYPGIGFVLNIEDLHHVLLSTGQLPDQTPSSHWLIVPVNSQAFSAAFAYAQKLRESTSVVRVEVELGHHHSQESIRDYARQRNIQQIAWVSNHDAPQTERLH